jgi:hypothetical protein
MPRRQDFLNALRARQCAMTDPQTQTAMMADAACGMLRMARALVESRRSIELAGLQDAIGRLCAACFDLPPEQGRAMRPQLTAVLAELDALSLALRATAEGDMDA